MERDTWDYNEEVNMLLQRFEAMGREDVDEYIWPLLEAINQSGLAATIYSCSGHGTRRGYVMCVVPPEYRTTWRLAMEQVITNVNLDPSYQDFFVPDWANRKNRTRMVLPVDLRQTFATTDSLEHRGRKDRRLAWIIEWTEAIGGNKLESFVAKLAEEVDRALTEQKLKVSGIGKFYSEAIDDSVKRVDIDYGDNTDLRNKVPPKTVTAFANVEGIRAGRTYVVEDAVDWYNGQTYFRLVGLKGIYPSDLFRDESDVGSAV